MGTRQRIRIKPDADRTPSTPRPRVQIQATAPHTGPTLLDAVADPLLFKPFFKDYKTWAVWFAIIAAIFAIPMTPEQLAHYQRVTGRKEPPTDIAKEVWLVIGRRGGKSRILALIAVWLACFFDYTEFLAVGERGTVQVIASDRKQARTIVRYVKAFLTHVPMLARMIESETQEGVSLNNSVTIEVATASFRSVRGFTLVAALLDELAFWQSEDSANPDTEVLAAIRPGMATIPNAMLLCASSPYARRGALYGAWKEHYGKDGDPVLVFQADTKTVNPAVDQKVIDDAYRDDPASASAEYGAQFRSDIESFISPDTVLACVSDGVHERGRETGQNYVAFLDPAGGSGKDSFTLAIGHKDKTTGLSVVDCIRETKPPFSPEAVVEDYAKLLKSYGIKRVLGDKYAGEWVREPFKKYGITYDPSAKAKSDIYRDALPLINSKKVDLLDHQKMVQQFVGLERRTARSGKDSIDHAPTHHDDICNVVAGLLVSIGVKPYGGYDCSMKWVGDSSDYDDWRAGRLHRFMMSGGIFR